MSVFDPAVYESDPAARVVVALDQLAQTLRSRLWQANRRYGLSPLQLQIVLGLAYATAEQGTVTHLARRLGVTKPTISAAVRMLVERGLATRTPDTTDRRRVSLTLTPDGRALADELGPYLNDWRDHVAALPDPDSLRDGLLQLLAALESKV